MAKERLTITLDDAILEQIDDLINGVTVRNRSHAIESILKKHLEPQCKKVLILAAGEGEKLRPLTYELPKALLPVHGQPLLEHTIELLKKNGFRDIVITVGHLGDKIREHFRDGSDLGVNITYSEEPRLLGTAGGIVRARSFVEDGPFLVLYGDTLFDIDLQKFCEFFFEHEATGAVALTSVQDPSTFGVVQLDGNTIVNFTEKPSQEKTHSHLISAGIYVFRPDIFDILPAKSPQEPLSLEQDIFPSMVDEGTLVGYPFSGQWFDITDPGDYERALKKWVPRD
mgnify:CR=1 FL=1